MIKEAIIKIVNKKDLSYNEAYTVMNEIMKITESLQILSLSTSSRKRAEL